MKERGGTIKKVVGWFMILLGGFFLVGAIADSTVGGWLRTASPSAMTASLTDIDRVSIRADIGQVRVATEDRPDLLVTVHGSDPGRVNVEFARQDGELQVRVSPPWWHRPRLSEPTPVEIRLPESFDQVLNLQVGTGSLAISGASPDRPATLKVLDLDVRVGKVEIRHVRVRSLNYNGQTGSLSTEWVQAEEAGLRLISGMIDLTHFVGALQVQLTSGSLEAQFDALSGAVSINQVTGKLVLGLPADAGFTVDARVGRGMIRSELPGADPPGPGRPALRLTHGAGTHAVDLRVETGYIIIR